MMNDRIIELDCREENNKVVLQWYLTKIKPLAKYRKIEDVPLSKIEKVITVLSKKYNMRIRDIVPDFWSNDEETIWRTALIDCRNLSTIAVIYGLSLYEALAKTAILMYSKRKEVGERKVKE